MSGAEPPPAGIQVQSVRKRFGRTVVLENIDLAVRHGEFLCLLGPSGCGKTTLLRSIAGLERPDGGRISIGAVEVVDVGRGLFVPPEQRGLGMVFQHYALWPHMSVRENLAYPLRKRKLDRAEQARRIRAVVEMVGLPAVLEQRPNQLSGGQQQRVALARALVYEPPVLLLDEPLSNLDAQLRTQLRRELRRLHDRLGTTTVLVTHDQEEAAALADTIAVIDQGRVAQVGSAAEILDAPRTRFVAEFVGFDNLIPGRITALHDGQVRIAIGSAGEAELPAPDHVRQGACEVLIAVRSDSLRLRIPQNGQAGVCGHIRHIARHARGIDLEIMLGDHLVLARQGGRERAAMLETGMRIGLDFHASHAVVLDAAAHA